MIWKLWLSSTGWLAGTSALLVAQGAAANPNLRLLEAGVFASAFGVMLWQQSRRESRISDEAKDREERLANRVTHLEAEINNRLFKACEANTSALVRVNETMERFAAARPCLIGDQPEKIIAALGGKK